jgi:hypothetical protein
LTHVELHISLQQMLELRREFAKDPIGSSFRRPRFRVAVLFVSEREVCGFDGGDGGGVLDRLIDQLASLGVLFRVYNAKPIACVWSRSTTNS